MPVPDSRLGVIVPSINVSVEDEFIAMGAGRVGLHFARATVDPSERIEKQFSGMVDHLPALAESLRHAGVSAIAFACTSASFFKGPEFSRDLARSIRDASEVYPVVTSLAVIEALNHLKVQQVAVATPYVEWVCERERLFLEDHGFEVTAICGLGRTGGVAISGITSAEVRSLVDDVNSESAEAIFISCTDLRSVHLADELEMKYEKPVITSNQATYWACASHLALEPLRGFGRLLSVQRDF